MDTYKKSAIEAVVDTAITAFSEGLISRYSDEVNDEKGVINMKKNNCFIAKLGEEFMFYSAFVRSLLIERRVEFWIYIRATSVCS